MALNRHQRAAQDLGEKLQLENELHPKLRSLFNQIIDDFNSSMLENGVPPDMTNWQSFFEELLLSHYQATSDIFSHRIRDQLDLVFSEEEDQQISTALSIYFATIAANSAENITKTNTAQAEEAVTRMKAQEVADIDSTGTPYDDTTRAAVATNIFRTVVYGRLVTIATTETQAAAEASKFVEADVANFKRPTINDAVISGIDRDDTKTWTAILDSVTRATHVEADGQTVKTSGFFIVGGYRMRFPGDRSADIAEWINCRCCSIYTPTNDALAARAR